MCVCVGACVRACVLACMHACMCVCVCVCVCACMCVCVAKPVAVELLYSRGFFFAFLSFAESIVVEQQTPFGVDLIHISMISDVKVQC